MTTKLSAAEKKQIDTGYNEALLAFDIATCEAVTVSQSIGVRMAKPHLGHSTFIFVRLCNHAISMICAAPRSRWIRADFTNWDFAGVAGHSRAILEGFLLLLYVVETPGSREEWSTKINVMYLNDCSRRIKMMGNIGSLDALKGLQDQAEELRGRLNTNSWFAALPAQTQKRCLTGEILMIPTRDEMLERAGWEKNSFYAMWDLLSQYAHALPISFFRMQQDGRGTGVENDTDKAYIARMMEWCAITLTTATDLMVEAFPHTSKVRKGLESKFTAGPRSNCPEPFKNEKKKR